MPLEDTYDAVETYFLTFNLEYGIFDSFEIVDNLNMKVLNLKPKKNIFLNSKLTKLMYFKDDWINIKLHNVWIRSEDYDWARNNSNRIRKELDCYLAEFKVNDSEEVMRVMMKLENYFVEIFKSTIL